MLIKLIKYFDIYTAMYICEGYHAKWNKITITWFFLYKTNRTLTVRIRENKCGFGSWGVEK